jgi:signal transduction histidine kinase
MNFFAWERFKRLGRLLATDSLEPPHQAERIVAMQRDVVLPSKLGLLLVVFYFLYDSGWFYDVPTTWSVVQELLQNYFLVYLACNIVGAVIFFNWRRLPPGLFQWLAFTMGLLDGLFAAGLTVFTGGFESIAFWVFPGLIVLNTLSIPLAVPQVVLNLILSLLYLTSVLSSPHLGSNDTAITVVPGRSATGPHTTNQPARYPEYTKPKKPVWSEGTGDSNPAEEVPGEVLLLRLSLLWLLTACGYGAQLLLERQRLAEAEAGEFAAREGQLRSAGRLAAEFAHQIKNPLAIINNAAFSLQRAARDGRAPATEQVQIIQEEVARADKVITQIMGYAQLTEGHVEKLNVVEELDRAIAQVFPAAVPGKIVIHREYGHGFPPLLMQRGHLSEVVVNLLQNAREALGDRGDVFVHASCHRDYSVEISVRDNGPGIPAEKIERVLEAYYTTKEKGTGLGLAIVKHNAELYGGTLRVESELGKGAKFTVIFPAKALITFSK